MASETKRFKPNDDDEENGDAVDAPGNISGFGSSNLARAALPTASNVDDESTRYAMKNRGRFIIINNEKFDKKSGMSDRPGSSVDAAALGSIFKMLKFDVQLYENITANEMKKHVKEAACDKSNSNWDCFGAAILSHGERINGADVVFGKDEYVTIDDLVKPLKESNSLAGKPKIFFFQACRGNEMDDGKIDASKVDKCDGVGGIKGEVFIPMEADFLYAYSTPSGYYSWRNQGDGSWFIQTLCSKLKQYASQDIDLLRILTRVNNAVATGYRSSAKSAFMTNKKQMPSIVSMLRKEIYFNE